MKRWPERVPINYATSFKRIVTDCGRRCENLGVIFDWYGHYAIFEVAIPEEKVIEFIVRTWDMSCKNNPIL